MTKTHSFLISLFLFSLLPFSYQDDADYFDFAVPRDDISYIVYANATTYVSFEYIEGFDALNYEVGELSQPPLNGEWLMEAITENGEVYYYVVENQDLLILGPNEFSVDATHDYAEARYISDDEAAYDISQFAPGVVGVMADQSGGFVG